MSGLVAIGGFAIGGIAVIAVVRIILAVSIPRSAVWARTETGESVIIRMLTLSSPYAW
jgi:hypothetical protein